MTQGIFEGIRVFEVGLYIATPLPGRILASQGAEVIRAVTTKAVDASWYGGPQPIGSVVPDLEAGKRHIALNMRHPEGQRVAKELIKKSDVFITNLTGEALGRFDLSPEAVRAVKPDIIMLWQPGFEVHGPYKDYKAFGGMLVSLVGLAEVTGFSDGAPMASGTAFCDYHSAVYAVLLITGALQRHRRTGKGTFIQLPLYEAGVPCLGVNVLDYFANHRIAHRMGNRHPLASPHGAYPCQGDDRWCVIACFTDKDWRGFCDAIGNPEWTRDSRFHTLADRIKNADDLDLLVAEWTRQQKAEEVMELMQRIEVPAGYVFKGEDLVENVHLRERNYWQETMYPVLPFGPDAGYAGPMSTFPIPMKFSETPSQFGSTGRIPEDNDYVYGELLKMPPEEIRKLTDEGVFV